MTNHEWLMQNKAELASMICCKFCTEQDGCYSCRDRKEVKKKALQWLKNEHHQK